MKFAIAISLALVATLAVRAALTVCVDNLGHIGEDPTIDDEEEV